MSLWTETSWTNIGRGAEGDLKALEKLFRQYLPKIKQIIRDRGFADHEDLAQSFGAELLASDFFKKADRAKGPFRNYLMGALFQFLAEEYRRGHAQKRGGGAVSLTLDELSEPEQHDWLSDPHTPEDFARRAEANAIMHEAEHLLAEEYSEPDRAEVYREVRKFLWQRPEPGEYEAIAERHGTSVNAVKCVVGRVRFDHRSKINSLLVSKNGLFAPIRPLPEPPTDPRQLAAYHWAAGLREQVEARIERDYTRRSDPERLDIFKPFLSRDPTDQQIAERLPLVHEQTPDEFRESVGGHRRRYRIYLLGAIWETCRDRQELVYEMLELRALLGV